MLMAAATHTHTHSHLGGSAAHSSSSTSPISLPPPPPWHPVVLVPNQHQHAALYDDMDLVVTPSPSPSATPHRLRPAASRSRRAGSKQQRRRPRPSRKLPTTYISADAASFRRMVHQVTGAADDDLPLPGPAATTTDLLRICRQAPPPSHAGLRTTAAAETMTLLPTLDTSAFLLGAAPARPGDPGAALQAEEARGSGGGVRGRGGGEYSCSSRCAGGGGEGFPSLEPWDDDDGLF